MLDDYFKTNPGGKVLPWTRIEPQSPSLQPVVIVMSYNDLISTLKLTFASSHLPDLSFANLILSPSLMNWDRYCSTLGEAIKQVFYCEKLFIVSSVFYQMKFVHILNLNSAQNLWPDCFLAVKWKKIKNLIEKPIYNIFLTILNGLQFVLDLSVRNPWNGLACIFTMEFKISGVFGVWDPSGKLK